MSSKDYVKHLPFTSTPVTGDVGDEYFNVITNKLYKNLVSSGTSLSYQEIPVFNSSGGLTISGNLNVNGGYTEKTLAANTGTAYTIDLTTGTLQILTLTGNCTFTFPTANVGQSFTLFLQQDATGSRSVTWPSSVKWPSSTPPTITSTASKGDKFVFTADGSYWWGSNAGQNYL
jgi:hypothetical protein